MLKIPRFFQRQLVVMVLVYAGVVFSYSGFVEERMPVQHEVCSELCFEREYVTVTGYHQAGVVKETHHVDESADGMLVSTRQIAGRPGEYVDVMMSDTERQVMLSIVSKWVTMTGFGLTIDLFLMILLLVTQLLSAKFLFAGAVAVTCLLVSNHLCAQDSTKVQTRPIQLSFTGSSSLSGGASVGIAAFFKNRLAGSVFFTGETGAAISLVYADSVGAWSITGGKMFGASRARFISLGHTFFIPVKNWFVTIVPSISRTWLPSMKPTTAPGFSVGVVRSF